MLSYTHEKARRGAGSSCGDIIMANAASGNSSSYTHTIEDERRDACYMAQGLNGGKQVTALEFIQNAEAIRKYLETGIVPSAA